MEGINQQPNFAKLPDTVEADAQLTGVSADASGNLQATYQKVLVDDDDGSSENDGDPVTLQVSSKGAAGIMAIIADEIAGNEGGTSNGVAASAALSATPSAS